MRSFTSRPRTDAVGVSTTPLPPIPPLKFSSFAGGYFRGAKGVAVPKNAAADALDVEVTRDDKLRRLAGTTRVESFGARTPSQVILHPALDFTSELVFINGSELGVKREGATIWQAAGLPLGSRYHYALYGDTLLLSNSRDKIFSREVGSSSITALPDLPLGKTMAVIAGRLYIGGASLSGNFEPMGQFWSGADSFDDTDPLNGSGGELLIADTGYGDAIIANRIVGLDTLAILCRRSIWIGRITGLPERPLDFQLRIPGKGAVSEACARTVHGGVMYLSDEGVELFDGNDPVHKSSQIDSAILPLNMDLIDLYTASYDPRRRWYYLFTPTATFIYDLRYDRWYKSSLVALGGTIFATQFPAVTWGEAVGTWGSQTMTWADMSPEESGVADMMFLGVASGEAYALEKEDAASTKYFGIDQAPLWVTGTEEAGQQSNKAYTAKAVRVEYEGTGLVEVQLLDGTSLGILDLVDSGFPDVVQMKCNQTARAIGLRIKPFDGQPIISSIEVDVVQRSQLRRLDARRSTKVAFEFSGDQPQVEISNSVAVSQQAQDDELHGDINVDDVAVMAPVSLISETDSTITVDLPEATSFGAFLVIGGEVYIDDAPASPLGALALIDPVSGDLVVDDALSGPAGIILEEALDSVTVDV